MDKKHFVILLLATIVTVFLSIFFSFWFFVGSKMPPKSDIIMQPSSPSMSIPADNSFKQIDEMMNQQQKQFDILHREFLNFGSSKMFKDAPNILSEETKDGYKIKVNLKPFNNDSNNVKVDVDDNVVRISAKYELKNKNKLNSSEISQSLVLPYEIDEDNIKKVKEGNYLVITIPKES